ncbi:motile sperm domain-containing protein 2-like isoform X2 [Mizuhopecten yessoensis]|uniref:motile sperm domain-containing protein 2-like isoform X2 n=1 Tax=Mizuhopecten yessoensis TaxID=6573 RepID=UPI000B45DC73|nr:motile sperm domain-containing protein 2-like isoform X2 [Mizuhopecten yessoensis]
MADGDSKDSPNIHSSNAGKLRKLFYSKYNVEDFVGKQLYDQRDADSVASNDLYVRQFIRTYESLEDAANRLHETLKWRKELGVNDLCETSFESWRYELGAGFYHNHDKDGRRLFFVKVKLHKKDAADFPMVKKFLAYHFETIYKEEPTKEIVVVFDMSQAGLSNLDMDLIKFVITCFKIYYPTLLGYMLIYEMPWLFNAAWKIIKAWLSPHAIAKIKFVTKSDIQEYINKDQLLEHMGGTDKFVYKYVPSEEREEEENKLKKRVTFAESAKTADGDGSPDSFQSPMGKSGPGMRKVGIRGTTGKMEPGVDNSFIGRLLTISPAEELEFSTDESGKETFDTICLKNTLPYPIAYKVKTTSPEKYKVRPSFGVAKPGSTVEVFVYLQQGYHNTISKDKFLVMAMEVTTESQDKLAELWKTIPKENIMEHKLRCVQSSKPSQGQGAGVDSSQEENVQTLAQKVDSLMESTRQTQRMLKALGALQLMIMFLLLVGLFLHYQFTPAESANYTSCPGSMW